MDIMKMAERLKAKPRTDGNAPERRRRGLSKLLVYPLMVLLFAGSLWLIFRPSEDGTEAVGGSGGFNTEMPSPESSVARWTLTVTEKWRRRPNGAKAR